MASLSARIVPDITVISADNSHVRLAAFRSLDAGAVGWPIEFVHRGVIHLIRLWFCFRHKKFMQLAFVCHFSCVSDRLVSLLERLIYYPIYVLFPWHGPLWRRDARSLVGGRGPLSESLAYLFP
jgi:hypothetical protein